MLHLFSCYVQGVGDVLTDWRITAQPPLTLRNDLPVAAHYVLWERPARGGSLVLRQQGRLEGWSSINVYSVDMRQQVRRTVRHQRNCDSMFRWCRWLSALVVDISSGLRVLLRVERAEAAINYHSSLYANVTSTAGSTSFVRQY